MSKNQSNLIKLKEKSNHYKTQLRNYKDQNKTLQSCNTKLKDDNKLLIEKNKELESIIQEQNRIIADNENNEVIRQTEEKKKKRIDTAISIIYYFGEFFIFALLTYDLSIKPVGDCFSYVIITALFLVIIYIVIHIFSGYKIKSLLSPFIDLIPSLLQSLLPLVAVSLFLWIKENHSLHDYLANNVELMVLLALTTIIFIAITITITALTYAIIGIIYIFKKLKKTL